MLPYKILVYSAFHGTKEEINKAIKIATFSLAEHWGWMFSLSVSTALRMKESSYLETVKETKRKAIPLTIICPTCGRPAPDHLHFGGEKRKEEDLN